MTQLISSLVFTESIDSSFKTNNRAPSGNLGLKHIKPEKTKRLGGLAVLFTGLPGAGKTTLARELVARLQSIGSQVTMLDGDDLRSRISPELGFTASDRAANLRRAALIASEVVRHGGIVVCSFIAPYEQSRVEMRKAVEQYGSFILVHVSTPLAECERRDPKGMYRKARSGQIQTFTGVSDCYEAPSTCELRIDTMNTTVDEVVDEVTRQIARKTLLTSFWRVYGKSAGIEDCEANCNPPSRGDDAAASQIRTFQAILDVLAKGKISMNEVSSALGASRHSIERSVRVVTGQTFRSLQQDLASERATALLNQGKSIKEVAFSLGFASPQAFHRFFLRTCGRTPSSLQQCSDEHGRIG